MKHPPLSRRSFAAVFASISGALALSRPAQAKKHCPDGAASCARLSADDRLAIIELIAEYTWAYDTENAQALGATFTPDGVLEVFGRPLVSGRDGFVAFMAQARDMKGNHGWQHLTDHHVFRDYDGASCKVYSYYVMPEGDASGGNVTLRAMGYYISHCVRDDDQWLFAKREVLRWTGKAPFAI